MQPLLFQYQIVVQPLEDAVPPPAAPIFIPPQDIPVGRLKKHTFAFVSPSGVTQNEVIESLQWFPEINQPPKDIPRRQYLYPTFFPSPALIPRLYPACEMDVLIRPLMPSSSVQPDMPAGAILSVTVYRAEPSC